MKWKNDIVMVAGKDWMRRAQEMDVDWRDRHWRGT